MKPIVLDKQSISRVTETRFIVLSSLIACSLLYIVEQIFAANYLTKTLAKVVLFVGIPGAYSSLLGTAPIALTAKRKGRQLALGSLRSGLILGVVASCIILATYVLLQGALDLPAIARELQEKSQVTPTNFLLVGLYITFGNSFLEEFFFRGFIFRSLHRLGKAKLGYCYSSLLFGLYHIAIFRTWFSPWLIGLALLGLISVGFIFNWINARSNHFYNSWLAHILADAAIILVGLRMFEMI